MQGVACRMSAHEVREHVCLVTSQPLVCCRSSPLHKYLTTTTPPRNNRFSSQPQHPTPPRLTYIRTVRTSASLSAFARAFSSASAALAASLAALSASLAARSAST